MVKKAGELKDYMDAHPDMTAPEAMTSMHAENRAAEEPAESVETTEPVATEPVVSEPVATEPVVSEPVATEPVELAASADDKLKKEAGEMPEGLKNYLDKKNGKDSDGDDDKKDDDKKDDDKKDDDKKDDDKKDDDKKDPSKEEKTEKIIDEEYEKLEKKDKKAEASADGCGCGKGDNCSCVKKSSYAQQIVAGAKKKTDKKKEDKKKKMEYKKKKMKTDKKKSDKKKDKSWGKKDMKMKKKCGVDIWAEFLDKKGYFQGADQESFEGKITSNDPDKLGYPGDIKYDRKPMAVPVGQDARPWEQKWFEGAADVTKKEMLPGGTDLAIKKEWQRAKWKAFFTKQANPGEFLQKMKKTKLQLAKEQAAGTANTDQTTELKTDPLAGGVAPGGA